VGYKAEGSDVMKSHEAVVIPEGERVAGVYQEYGDLIAALRSQGKTLQQIGDQLGVTRERVRQVLSKHFPECSIPPSTEEAAKKLGMSYRHFRRTAERLGIRPIGRSRNRIRWSPDVLPAIWTAYKLRSCRICGRDLAPNRSVYCSEECVREAKRYGKRSLKQKETVGSPAGR